MAKVNLIAHPRKKRIRAYYQRQTSHYKTVNTDTPDFYKNQLHNIHETHNQFFE